MKLSRSTGVEIGSCFCRKSIRNWFVRIMTKTSSSKNRNTIPERTLNEGEAFRCMHHCSSKRFANSRERASTASFSSAPSAQIKISVLKAAPRVMIPIIDLALISSVSFLKRILDWNLPAVWTINAAGRAWMPARFLTQTYPQPLKIAQAFRLTVLTPIY